MTKRIQIQLPADVLEELRKVAECRGLRSPQALIRAYMLSGLAESKLALPPEAKPESQASPSLPDRWRAEATEREARAADPEVVGVIERDVEAAVVRTLRRCAAEVEATTKEARGAGLAEYAPQAGIIYHTTSERVKVLERRRDRLLATGYDPGTLRIQRLSARIAILKEEM